MNLEGVNAVGLRDDFAAAYMSGDDADFLRRNALSQKIEREIIRGRRGITPQEKNLVEKIANARFRQFFSQRMAENSATVLGRENASGRVIRQAVGDNFGAKMSKLAADAQVNDTVMGALEAVPYDSFESTMGKGYRQGDLMRRLSVINKKLPLLFRGAVVPPIDMEQAENAYNEFIMSKLGPGA